MFNIFFIPSKYSARCARLSRLSVRAAPDACLEHVEPVAARVLASLSGRVQASMARDSYSYIHLFMVFGIVLVALGLKKTLLDIDAPLQTVVSAALFGGIALYLLAHVAFRLRNTNTVNVARLVVSVILIALIPFGALLPSLTSLGTLAGILIALVTYEVIRFRKFRHRIRFDEH